MDRMISFEKITGRTPRGKRVEGAEPIVEVSWSTLWKWEREGRFPLRRALGPNKVGWLASELEAWIESRRSK